MNFKALIMAGAMLVVQNTARADVRFDERLLPDPLVVLWLREERTDGKFIMPADGRLSSFFGMRFDPLRRGERFHSGIDLAAPWGSSIRAAGGGTVAESGWAGGCGLAVTIEHAGNVETRYCHMGRVMVKKGDGVRTGDLIGAMGVSGRATGPHLHFEVISNGEKEDPAGYLVF